MLMVTMAAAMAVEKMFLNCIVADVVLQVWVVFVSVVLLWSMC